MKTSNELAASINEKREQLSKITATATAEKRSLKNDTEFTTCKNELDDLKIQHENAVLIESELRSMPSIAVLPTADENQIGKFVKSGEQRFIGLGYGAEVARGKNYSSIIVTALNKVSLMRQKARQTTVDGDSFVETIGLGGCGAVYNREGDAYNGTADIRFSQVKYKLAKMTASPKMTEETIDQSSIVNIEDFVIDNITKSIGLLEESTFWYARASTTMPSGILTGTFTETKATPIAAEKLLIEIETVKKTTLPTATDLIDLVASLKTPYQNNAEFYLSRTTWRAISALVDTNKVPLMGRLTDKIGFQLLGYPVNIVDVFSNSDCKNGNKVVLFGDMSEAYQIVNSSAPLKITRDEISEPQFVKFNTRMYNAGGLRNAEALKCFMKTT